MFPLHSGRQAVPHSREPSAICSCESDNARDGKAEFFCLKKQSACGCLEPKEVNYPGCFGAVLDLNVSLFFKEPAPVSGKTHLRGLEVLQRGRTTWKQQGRPGVQCLQDAESIRSRTEPIFLIVTGRKMNLSARVVFGKGHLAPKHLSFSFPQTDSQRKGSRSAGGKKGMFSFSLRCRLGIIKGRTKGKGDVHVVEQVVFPFNIVLDFFSNCMYQQDLKQMYVWFFFFLSVKPICACCLGN